MEIKNKLPIFVPRNNKSKTIMSEKHIPVGISDNEIFIAKVVDGEFKYFDGVLRPVTVKQLEYMRDQYERRDEYKEFWKEAVQADATEDSFDDWLDQVWSEEYDEDDPEDFPTKDDSDMQYLSEEDRLKADWFLGTQGIEVGTWECSGCYSPASFNKEFKHFDYVFMNPEAERIAKEYEESTDKD